MKTLEILFTNRRKEKLSADTINLTEAPGWVIFKNDGAVAEMISMSVVKRIKFVPTPVVALATAAVTSHPPEELAPAEATIAVPVRHTDLPLEAPEQRLTLPLRPPYMPARPQPIVPSRRYA